MDDVCVSVCECMFVTQYRGHTTKTLPIKRGRKFWQPRTYNIIVHNLQTRTFSIYPQTLFTGCNDA